MSLLIKNKALLSLFCSLLLLGAVVASASTAQAAPLITSGEQTVTLNEEHVDLVSVRYAAGKLQLKTRADLKNGEIGKILEPANIVVQLNSKTKSTVPNNPAYLFLGEAGDPVWLIPQAFRTGVVWAGWETESLKKGTFQKNQIQLELIDVSGPGNVEVYFYGDEGPERVFSSKDNSYKKYQEMVGSHTHANWAFSKPGNYQLTFQAQGKLNSGQQLVSEAVTYQVQVLDGKTNPEPDKSSEKDNTGLPNKNDVSGNDDQSGFQYEKSKTITISTCLATDTADQVFRSQSQENTVFKSPELKKDTKSKVSAGHFDVGPIFDNGRLLIRVKDDRTSPAKWQPAANYRFTLEDAAKTTIPNSKQYGNLAGTSGWQIPLTQNPDVPWIGWNTQHPSIAGKAESSATLSLDYVSGPGKLAVYSTGPFGDISEKYFGNYPSFPSSTEVPVGNTGVHVHGIWLFTQPGKYEIGISYQLRINGKTEKASTTLYFQVGTEEAQIPKKAEQAKNPVTANQEFIVDCADRSQLAKTGIAGPAITDLLVLASASLLLGTILSWRSQKNHSTPKRR